MGGIFQSILAVAISLQITTSGWAAVLAPPISKPISPRHVPLKRPPRTMPPRYEPRRFPGLPVLAGEAAETFFRWSGVAGEAIALLCESDRNSQLDIQRGIVLLPEDDEEEALYEYFAQWASAELQGRPKPPPFAIRNQHTNGSKARKGNAAKRTLGPYTYEDLYDLIADSLDSGRLYPKELFSNIADAASRRFLVEGLTEYDRIQSDIITAKGEQDLQEIKELRKQVRNLEDRWDRKMRPRLHTLQTLRRQVADVRLIQSGTAQDSPASTGGNLRLIGETTQRVEDVLRLNGIAFRKGTRILPSSQDPYAIFYILPSPYISPLNRVAANLSHDQNAAMIIAPLAQAASGIAGAYSNGIGDENDSIILGWPTVFGRGAFADPVLKHEKTHVEIAKEVRAGRAPLFSGYVAATALDSPAPAVLPGFPEAGPGQYRDGFLFDEIVSFWATVQHGARLVQQLDEIIQRRNDSFNGIHPSSVVFSEFRRYQEKALIESATYGRQLADVLNRISARALEVLAHPVLQIISQKPVRFRRSNVSIVPWVVSENGIRTSLYVPEPSMMNIRRSMRRMLDDSTSYAHSGISDPMTANFERRVIWLESYTGKSRTSFERARELAQNGRYEKVEELANEMLREAERLERQLKRKP